MAVTAEQRIDVKGLSYEQAFPVKSGETMYQGTVGAILSADGFLYNNDATAAAASDMAVIIKDSTANVSGPAATTADGSISGDKEQASAVAGDKTVRRCYVEGNFTLPLTSASQATVGKAIYASDNYTFTTTSTSNLLVGTCVGFVNTDTIIVALNKSY